MSILYKLASAEGLVPPQAVADRAKWALEVREKLPQSRRAMTSVGIGRAKQLASREEVPASDLKKMKSYFSRHRVDKKGKDFYNNQNPSKGRQAWDGWGGDPGESWVNGPTVTSFLAKQDKP